MEAENVDLKSYLEAALGHDLTQDEIAESIGVSTSTLKRRKTEGFYVSEILTALDHFNLSRTSGLLALGILELEDAMNALGEDGALVDDTSTLMLAEILAQRLRETEGLPAFRTESGKLVTLDTRTTNVREENVTKTTNAKQKRSRLRRGLLE